jgi:ketosteroid isomerase-like protein
MMAPDIEVSWSEPPLDVVSRGPEEVTARLRLLLQQWENFRAEVMELTPVGDSSALAVARQRATGRGSGVEVDAEVYIVLTFRGDQVSGVHWHFDRGRALAAAGLGEPGHD